MRFEQAEQRPWRRPCSITLRPYGGVACVWGPLADRSRIEEIVKGEAFPGASVRQAGDFVLLARSGPLPGAADWSHAEANAASTGASEDEFIRSPMSVLWFDAAQRWHKYPGAEPGSRGRRASGPPRKGSVAGLGRVHGPQAVGGRVVRRTAGPPGHPLRAAPTMGAIVPACRRRRSWWSSRTRSTWATARSCRVFDPATGKQTGRIALPEDLNTPWANLRVCDDYLVGSSGRTCCA